MRALSQPSPRRPSLVGADVAVVCDEERPAARRALSLPAGAYLALSLATARPLAFRRRVGAGRVEAKLGQALREQASSGGVTL